MSRPPRLAARVVRWSAARLSWGETACGDLAEEHSELAARRGAVIAGFWYWGQAVLLAISAFRRVAGKARAAAARFFFLGDRPMTSLFHEARIAGRALRRYPFVSATIVLTLALGLGVNAATFGWIDSLVLRPFPFQGVDRMVMLSENTPEDQFPQESVAPANFFDLRRQATVFDGLAAFRWWDVNLAGADQPERIQGFRVSADFFRLLGTPPVLGRLLDEHDDVWGAPKQVVISHGLWQRRFGSDPAIVSRSVRLDGESYMIAGVAAPGFDFPAGSEVWGALAFDQKSAANRTDTELTVIARLGPDATFEDAEAQTGLIYQRMKDSYPEVNRQRQLVVRTFTAGMIDVALAPILALWQAAALLVLLIGCTNVANLLIAQGATRQRELAVRLAIGASRWRIVRQLLIENLLLSLIAAPTALGVAAIAFGLFQSAMPAQLVRFLPGWTTMGVDGRVVAFTIGASVLTALIFGLLPALQASRPGLSAALRDGGRSISGSVSRSRLRRGLVVAEFALALPLLVASGLAAIGAQRFAIGPQGYDPDGVLRLRMILPEAMYQDGPARWRFTDRVREEASRIPGVSLAATTSSLPASGSNQRRDLVIDGRPVDPDRPLSVNYRAVSPDYLRLLRVPLRQGRGLTTGDSAESERVAVISQSMADRYWPGANALGKRIRLGRGDDVPWTTVVGVVGDTIDDWFMYRREPTAYVPVAQAPSTAVNLVLRTGEEPTIVADGARKAIAAVDPLQPAFEVMTMREALRVRTIGLRFIGWLMAVFGALALILATVGIYSVMAHFVAQRRNEIGIRMALGASSRQVTRLTASHAARMAGAGMAIGVVLGVLLSRTMESALFGIVAVELWLFGAIVTLLAVVTFAASLIPARQASKVDPVVALRSE